MRCLVFLAFIAWIVIASCDSGVNSSAENVPAEVTLRNNIAALKDTAITGDLVVRLGDDLISERVKYLNEKDYAYSHGGIIVEIEGRKSVVHITPDANYNDTIQIESIDSFLNPMKNLSCGLYRYDLTAQQRTAVSKTLESYKGAGVKFDRKYNLATNDRMYCSEMIAKAVTAASDGHINFRQVNVPQRMQMMVAGFLKAEKISPGLVAQTKILTIDNLYSVQECTLLTSFWLKQLPDQQ